MRKILLGASLAGFVIPPLLLLASETLWRIGISGLSSADEILLKLKIFLWPTGLAFMAMFPGEVREIGPYLVYLGVYMFINAMIYTLVVFSFLALGKFGKAYMIIPSFLIAIYAIAVFVVR